MVETKDELVVQNGELFGKGRAALRNEQLIQLIREWEKQRDDLLDEIANKKGKVEILELLVKQSYEKILEVNKQEQAKEQEIIDKRFQEIRIKAESEEEQVRAADVLKLHKQKQEEVIAGLREGKTHPSDRARELSDRQEEARKKRVKE